MCDDDLQAPDDGILLLEVALEPALCCPTKVPPNPGRGSLGDVLQQDSKRVAHWSGIHSRRIRSRSLRGKAR